MDSTASGPPPPARPSRSASALPSLAVLQAFAAVARLKSFRRAAEELCVTKSAVSHQIQSLEALLGVKLLARGAGEVALTPAGERFLPEVVAGLDRLASAVARVKVHVPEGPLTISLLPTFASRWLIPRLMDFRQKHPDLDVRLDATTQIVGFSGTDIDVAIRYGLEPWPGLHCDELLAESLLPVCSPAIARGPLPLKVPQDLARHTLLQNGSHLNDWPLWLARAGVPGIDASRGPVFPYAELLLRAATEGLGVAIARYHLVEADLAAGTLVAPFRLMVESGFRYWLVCPPAALADARVAAFREWLLGQFSTPLSHATRGSGAGGEGSAPA